MGEVGARVERHGEGRGRGVRGDASSTEGEAQQNNVRHYLD